MTVLIEGYVAFRLGSVDGSVKCQPTADSPNTRGCVHWIWYPSRLEPGRSDPGPEHLDWAVRLGFKVSSVDRVQWLGNLADDGSFTQG